MVQSTIFKLPQPDEWDLNNIRSHIFSSHNMGGPLTARDGETWGTPEIPNIRAPDLITLQPREKVDKLSDFISKNTIKYLYWPLKKLQPIRHRVDGKVGYYDDSVRKITYGIVGIFAGLAPILSIFVLSQLHTMKARLWTIAAFNVGIALSLQLFTRAERTDIFAVTAA